MPALTVRRLDDDVYEGLKSLAAARHASMEAEARDILREGVARRRRWVGATLADLAGDPVLATIETPFVRASGQPREVEF